MNDAFNESKDQGQLAWLKQWSEVIAGKLFSFYACLIYNLFCSSFLGLFCLITLNFLI